MPGMRPSVTAALLVLIAVSLQPRASIAQTTSPFSFRSGQSMYIVAFRRYEGPPAADPLLSLPTGTRTEYIDLDLDAERKARNQIEKWHYFRVADKPSEADFIYLVNLDSSSIEALALPFDAYQRHFREKFDLDALREAAYGRYMAGPLNLPTISRLTDRVVKQFRAKITGSRG